MSDDADDDLDLLRQYRSAAIAALASGDYNMAINQALAAQLLLATVPSNAARGGGPSGGNQSLAWSPEAIDNFILRCRQQGAAAAGIVSVPITRSNPDQTGDSFDEPI
jgi:hypothetical protein